MPLFADPWDCERKIAFLPNCHVVNSLLQLFRSSASSLASNIFFCLSNHQGTPLFFLILSISYTCLSMTMKEVLSFKNISKPLTSLNRRWFGTVLFSSICLKYLLGNIIVYVKIIIPGSIAHHSQPLPKDYWLHPYISIDRGVG